MTTHDNSGNDIGPINATAALTPATTTTTVGSAATPVTSTPSAASAGTPVTPVTDCPTGICPLPTPPRDDDELFDLLDDAAAEQSLSAYKLVPNPLIISKRCLALGHMIGEITRDVDGEGVGKGKGRNLEVGGFYLIDGGDDTFTLCDFIVPNDLPVSQGNIVVAEQFPMAGLELRTHNETQGTDLRMAAMFHIHPTLVGGLAHSSADDAALTSLVNKMKGATERSYPEPFRLIDRLADKVKEYTPEGQIIKGDAFKDVVQKFIFPNDGAFYALLQHFGFHPDKKYFQKQEFLARLLDTVDISLEEPRVVHFAASFVFNYTTNGPFVKMGIGERRLFTGEKPIVYTSDVPLQVIDLGEPMPTEAEVAQLVRERIRFPPRPKVFTRTRSKSARGGGSSLPTGYPPDATSYQSHGDTWRQQWGPVQPTSPWLQGQGASNASGGPVTPKRQTDDKVTDKNYRLTEIADLFTLAAHSYVLEWRHDDCKFSEYLDDVLTSIDRFSLQQGYGVSTISGGTRQPSPVFGFREAVKYTGPISDDPLKEVFTPRFAFYHASGVAKCISAGLKENPDDNATIQFMFRFIYGSTDSRNTALQRYVTQVAGEYVPLPQSLEQIEPTAHVLGTQELSDLSLTTIYNGALDDLGDSTDKNEE